MRYQELAISRRRRGNDRPLGAFVGKSDPGQATSAEKNADGGLTCDIVTSAGICGMVGRRTLMAPGRSKDATSVNVVGKGSDYLPVLAKQRWGRAFSRSKQSPVQFLGQKLDVRLSKHIFMVAGHLANF